MPPSSRPAAAQRVHVHVHGVPVIRHVASAAGSEAAACMGPQLPSQHERGATSGAERAARVVHAPCGMRACTQGRPGRNRPARRQLVQLPAALTTPPARPHVPPAHSHSRSTQRQSARRQAGVYRHMSPKCLPLSLHACMLCGRPARPHTWRAVLRRAVATSSWRSRSLARDIAESRASRAASAASAASRTRPYTCRRACMHA